MMWTVAAPMLTAAINETWIDDFVPPAGDRFRKVPAPTEASRGWHNRRRRATSLGGWQRVWQHSSAALKDADGIITVFPQLALAAAVQRELYHRRVPIVAWCFNLGAFPTGLKRVAARLALRRVERIVVHSSGEVPLLSEMLGTDDGVVQFVPLQRAPIPVLAAEDISAPFIVAMGSANRDYRTLFEAARRTKLPVTVVAAPRLIEGLDPPANVTIKSNMTIPECWELAQRARFSVVPLADIGAASGQTTVIEAMRMDRPVIATRTIGTVDYIEHGKTGLLVPPSDVEALSAAMEYLWDDAQARRTLVKEAADFAERVLSDEAAGRSLGRIIKEAKEARA